MSTGQLKVSTIRQAFWPLGILSKCFGLFPCFDLSFTQKLSNEKLRIIHILDYCYTGVIFTVMTAGAVFCTIRQPIAIQEMSKGSDKTDFYVVMTVFYMTIIMGIVSLSIFPKKFSLLLHYIEHFSSFDKLLELPESTHRTEQRFGLKLLTILLFDLVLIIISFYVMFILESPNLSKPYTDFLLIPVEALAGMARLVPGGLLIFFMNSIRIRLSHFNTQMNKLILPITPSCFNCDSYAKYGLEANLYARQLSSKQSLGLAWELDKMRVLYEDISELMAETSLIFGSHIVRDFLYSILGIILYSYFTLFLREENLVFWCAYPFMVLLTLIKLFALSTFSQFITNEEVVTLKMLQKVSILYLAPECTEQIRSFVKKLDKPLTISGSGYFIVNRKLITSIIGAIMTYFVILVQFKLAEDAMQLRKSG